MDKNQVYSVISQEGRLCGLFSSEIKAKKYIKRLNSICGGFKIHIDCIDELDEMFCYRVIYYLDDDNCIAGRQTSKLNLQEIGIWYHLNDDAEYIWTHVIAKTEKEAKVLGMKTIKNFLDSLDDFPLTFMKLKDNKYIIHHETHGSYF